MSRAVGQVRVHGQYSYCALKVCHIGLGFKPCSSPYLAYEWLLARCFKSALIAAIKSLLSCSAFILLKLHHLRRSELVRDAPDVPGDVGPEAVQSLESKVGVLPSRCPTVFADPKSHVHCPKNGS